jgi:hypothetical protein
VLSDHAAVKDKLRSRGFRVSSARFGSPFGFIATNDRERQPRLWRSARWTEPQRYALVGACRAGRVVPYVAAVTPRGNVVLFGLDSGGGE